MSARSSTRSKKPYGFIPSVIQDHCCQFPSDTENDTSLSTRSVKESMGRGVCEADSVERRSVGDDNIPRIIPHLRSANTTAVLSVRTNLRSLRSQKRSNDTSNDSICMKMSQTPVDAGLDQGDDETVLEEFAELRGQEKHKPTSRPIQSSDDTDDDEWRIEESASETVDSRSEYKMASKKCDNITNQQESGDTDVTKHHPLLGVVSTMETGRVYLHCECGHVRRVESVWQDQVPVENIGFVDQTLPCPHSKYRRTNSFKKMKNHLKKCFTKMNGTPVKEIDIPPFFQRTYKNKPLNQKRRTG